METDKTIFFDNPVTALKLLRRDIVKMAARSGHVAVALSCIEIVTVLYFRVLKTSPALIASPERDRFILSKGHGCMALYAVLARAGFFDVALLDTYCLDGSLLAEHPLADEVPGVEFATGTLGHGLPVAVGGALASRIDGTTARHFVLMGDGECDEGSVWEAAALGAAHKLDNLTAIIDWNGFQACGTCKDITGNVSLADKWRSFGWDVESVDGHDIASLEEVFLKPHAKGVPRAVLCKTVKGKGVDFMEEDLEWHYRPVCGSDVRAAFERIGNA